MDTKDILDKVLYFIRELTQFYGELSRELPDLRVVVDNTNYLSELKKMPRRAYRFGESRNKPVATPDFFQRMVTENAVYLNMQKNP